MNRLQAPLFWWGINAAAVGFTLGVWVERGWIIWWAFALQLVLLPVSYFATVYSVRRALR